LVRTRHQQFINVRFRLSFAPFRFRGDELGFGLRGER
jgi:hypothetical protein